MRDQTVDLNLTESEQDILRWCIERTLSWAGLYEYEYRAFTALLQKLNRGGLPCPIKK